MNEESIESFQDKLKEFDELCDELIKEELSIMYECV